MRGWFVILFGLLLTGCQSAPMTVDDQRYTLTRGESWKGVKVGGMPVRNSSVICYQKRCYRMSQFIQLPRQLLDKYQLGSAIRFADLSQAPGVERVDDTLLLPDDLGWQLFQVARQYEWRERRDNLLWPI